MFLGLPQAKFVTRLPESNQRGDSNSHDLHVQIVSDLKAIILDSNNVLVNSFRMAKDKMIQERGSKVRLKLIGK